MFLTDFIAINIARLVRLDRSKELFSMRITRDLFIVFCYLIFGSLVSAKLAVKISKKVTNRTAQQKVNVPSFMRFDKAAYPQPLPTYPPKKVVMSPYTTLYQGLRYKDDLWVFRKKFDYEAMIKGQQIVCQGLFDCVISHIAIESTEAIPVLLRGGAGYRHFTAVIKAKPHHELKGQVRAYCRNKYEPPADEEPKKKPDKPRRRFFFGDRLAEENWR